MKILLVNKFLYSKGGSETYVLKLGEILTQHGHEVEYFGLENEKNTVKNRVGAYVSDIDFDKGALKNLKAPFRVIYSSEARRKIRRVLDDFEPDAVHFNNIQFHLTPSIILETEKYRQDKHRDVKIIYTAHDFQLVCASHGLFDSDIRVCEKCLGSSPIHCFKTKCHKNSRTKSLLATLDAYRWRKSAVYSYVDKIICPSAFLKSKLDTDARFRDKTVVLHNFFEQVKAQDLQKEDYVLEFGHLSRDKGTLTLLEVARRMPRTKFVFAGYGEAVEEIAKVENAEYVGFKTGEELTELIKKALVSVTPSEIYENCPFSVIESQVYKTPVIASDMGGIPELIREGETGLLFEVGNPDDLEKKLRFLLETEGELERFTENCERAEFETPETYYRQIIEMYGDKS